METTQPRQPVPRVKMDDVKAKVVDVEYIYLHDRMTTCVLKMENGAYVEGTAFTIDAAYNVKELGEQAAYQKALSKAYEMEAYLQLQRFHDMRLASQNSACNGCEGTCQKCVIDLAKEQKVGPLDSIYSTEDADRRCLTGSPTIQYEQVFCEEALNNMVNRFLGWPLPQSFAPDCGISFTPLGHPNSWPIGTNLFDAEQAKAMFKHCVQVVPSRLGSISEPTLTAGPAISTENLVHDPKEPV